MHRKGFALPALLLLLLVFTALSVGLFHLATSAMQVNGTDMDATRAYYGAEGAMEKMMSDLTTLFTARQSPSVAEIRGLEALVPDLPEITYPEYVYDVPVEGGAPKTEVRHVSAGANEGLMAYIMPLTLHVTARGPADAEVRMERDIEVALIPVFQFGMFSDTDLSYHPGPDFDFGGRVHANGNLFLSTRASSGLTFHAKVSAAGEIIRKVMLNGQPTEPDRAGPIWIPTAPGGCDGRRPACRDLQENEGSKVRGPDSEDNPNWYHLSTTVYNGMVISRSTGAKRLDLPFVQEGVGSVQIIRRPQEGGVEPPSLSASRLHSQAQLRVLLSDDPSELPDGAVRLANQSPYFEGGTYGETDTAFAEGNTSWDSDFVRPPGAPPSGSWPLIDGYLVVQALRTSGVYENVTMEWLNLGIARENAQAILRFQSLKDTNGDGSPDYSATPSNLRRPDRFLPLNLYDPREGEVRDISRGSSDTTGAIGGIFSVVELDVNNLRRWLSGEIGATGGQVEYESRNGYILYFSDRRGMLPGSEGKDGTYGFEDIINPGDPNGLPDGAYHPAEDVNDNGALDTYGGGNLGDGFGAANGNPTTRVNLMRVGRKNRVTGARHAVKLVNGRVGNLPARPDGGGGFTVASENPVYVQGNYNADSSGFSSGSHVSASIIADAVTLLSNAWRDIASFKHPTYLGSGSWRQAADTWYRMAVAGGKNKPFDRPSWGSEEYGLDGGTHNFLRYIEDWSNAQSHYKGSLVSLYFSQYAVGIYKCCEAVYKAPVRDYSFDSDFLEPQKLPPGTPMFKDIVNLGFRQIFQVEDTD
ncbi:MAG TPA: hypothetical protein PLM33_00275 [Acidobacteriota bacterium]|nr:hypothetical protein [Acidobacteriota bacterium]